MKDPLYPPKKAPLLTPCGSLEDTLSVHKEDIEPYLAPQMCHQLHLPAKGWTRAVLCTSRTRQDQPGELFSQMRTPGPTSANAEADSPGEALW